MYIFVSCERCLKVYNVRKFNYYYNKNYTYHAIVFNEI